jgi:2-polyprenyl-3-methyl-5-hydroxy-6-metoxy-1,4-benzoquinol methylase
MLSMFEAELKKIDAQMEAIKPRDIPQLFKNVPLDLFGKLLLDIPPQYSHIKAFFPSMASEEVQKNWTGTHGQALLNQSLAFIKTMVFGYAAVTGKKIENASILDYGCGWGRLIRLLYKYISVENIYGVDPWDESIRICNQHGVKGNLAISEYVPVSLPFERPFDLIFAFSVFTHLSEKTVHTVLATLRKYISPEGILVITIRPKEYWSFHKNGSLESEMLKIHEKNGFAFTPHNRPPVNGDITYGDTSMTLAYLASNFPQWKVESVECNEIDLYQVVLFLKPV